jgi:hypothetical protein
VSGQESSHIAGASNHLQNSRRETSSLEQLRDSQSPEWRFLRRLDNLESKREQVQNDSDKTELGLTMTLPVASAGATLRNMVATGALKGHMAAQTPSGSFVTIFVKPVQLDRGFISILSRSSCHA